MAEAARPLVILTRPQGENEALASRLRALGYDPLIEPLLEIVSVRAEVPSLDEYAGLIFTSTNGVRAFAAQSAMRHLPSYAVGGATAAALRNAGFREVRRGPGEAEGLAALIAAEQPRGARLFHASGAVIAKDMGDLLAAPGIKVDRIALYDAIPVDRFSDSFVQALYACTVGFVIFFSARTAEIFGTVALRMGLTERCRSMEALCLSQRVATKAASVPWTRIAVPSEPTEEALLSLLPARETDG